ARTVNVHAEALYERGQLGSGANVMDRTTQPRYPFSELARRLSAKLGKLERAREVESRAGELARRQVVERAGRVKCRRASAIAGFCEVLGDPRRLLLGAR